jgi:hypothetical protein
MVRDPHLTEAMLREYDKTKEKIRFGLEVYDKTYALLSALVAGIAGLIGTAQIPNTLQGSLLAAISFVVLECRFPNTGVNAYATL